MYFNLIVFGSTYPILKQERLFLMIEWENHI